MRSCFIATILLLAVTVAAPAWAQATDVGAVPPPPLSGPARQDLLTVDEYHAQVARNMEAKIAQQDRAAKRALSAVCAGCSGSAGRTSHRPIELRRLVGPDGLPYEPGDIE
jgi:hypothetical protein